MSIADAPRHFDRLRAGDVAELLGMFPRGSFASPFRSTVPLG